MGNLIYFVEAVRSLLEATQTEYNLMIVVLSKPKRKLFASSVTGEQAIANEVRRYSRVYSIKWNDVSLDENGGLITGDGQGMEFEASFRALDQKRLSTMQRRALEKALKL